MIRLSALAGNDPIKSSLRQGLPGQAFLLEGEVGSGRHTLADLLTRAAVCLHDGDVPCGTCNACCKMDSRALVDVISVPSTAKVDELREILASVAIYPNDAKRKVYVIDSAEKLGAVQQNVLLKTLEEPPPFAIFLLICFAKESLLPTIRSRCTVFSLKPVTDGEATDYLRARFPARTEEAIRKAVSVSGGYLGKAVAFLSTENEEKNEVAMRVCEALAGRQYVVIAQQMASQRDRESFRKTVTDVKGSLKKALSAAAVSENARFCDSTEKRLVSLGVKTLSACAAVFEEIEEKCLFNINVGLWSVYASKECRRILE